jgi:DNA-binding IclR family transcriptional regulator
VSGNPVTLILGALREVGYPLSAGELAERTGLRQDLVYGYLRGMTYHGDITKTGRNPSQYALPARVAS